MPDSIIKADNISSLSGGGVGFPDGSVSNPSMKFTNDTDTGLYRIGNNTIGISSGGVKVGEIGSGYGGFIGNIIQVIQVSNGTGQTFNSGSANQTTFYDITGLSLSITPRSANNKILLLGSIAVGQQSDQYNSFLRFLRDSTNVGSSDSLGNGRLGHASMRSFSGAQYINISMNWLDSPSSTSSITYKIQICNSGGSTYPSFINRPQSISSEWMFGVTSVFTAMEIAQ